MDLSFASSSGCKVVEHLPHLFKVEGLSSATAAGKELRKWKRAFKMTSNK
jgi:hypothetical protein